MPTKITNQEQGELAGEEPVVETMEPKRQTEKGEPEENLKEDFGQRN